ncbi:DUF4302 domain-containing protein [Sphingobacterium griseoflavum]|uniref:DUF4302 domain-containing protein n=1 Tax=Sphingobacterium griseoflavum TaxID=1474952 RepID=A0ABQ3HV81_9SPHI|nr:DUF4302 domain-containing protein [Sphingobacterium griseoflavum]GHE31403.1 hypothetical protein GCM10017764_13140 [Sphingobacterium griseoflavum]
MKFRSTHIFIFLVVLFAFGACKKEDDPILADPDSRLSEYLANSLAFLTEAPYGYKASLETVEGKTFTLFMQFDSDGRVHMLSDFADASAATVGSSSYRLKALQRPSLIFDTYNYISIFADPQGSVNGGTNGQGLKGDNDYSFVKFSGDTVSLLGNKNASALTLIRASEDEKDGFIAGQLRTSREVLHSYLQSNSNLYIADGTNKVAFAVDANNRTVTLSRLEEDGITISSVTSSFAYTQQGITPAQLTFNGAPVEAIAWQASTSRYTMQTNGSSYVVESNPTPVFPLYLQFGFNKTYSTIGTTTNSLPAGVNSAFNDVWSTVNANFTSTNRAIRYMEFKIISETQATLSVFYSSGTSNFVADMSFTYSLQQNLLTLTSPRRDYSNGNWTTRLAQLRVLEEYILKGPFVLDWVDSSSPTVTVPLGGLRQQSDSQSFLYGFLK